MSSRAMRQPLSLRLTSNSLLILWCVIAAFPIFWITVMSFKTPVDAFDANALNVIFGPETRAKGHGVSLFDICLLALLLWGLWRGAARLLPSMVRSYAPAGTVWLGWLIGAAAFALVALVTLFGLLPVLSNALNPVLGAFGADVIGLTTEHYKTV